MIKRELHCPNLQVQKVATLLAPPRPVKPSHPPIADIIRVSTSQQTGNGNASRQLCKIGGGSTTCHTSFRMLLGQGAPDVISKGMCPPCHSAHSTLHGFGCQDTEHRGRSKRGGSTGARGGGGGQRRRRVLLRHPRKIAGCIGASKA